MTLEDIREMLLELIKRKPAIISAKVVSVDWDKRTCVCLPSGEPEVIARLQSAIDTNESALLIKPSVGSSVLIGSIADSDEKYTVVKYGAIDECYLKCGDSIINITNDQIILNEGSNGGLINISQLQNEYNKTKAVVDAIANTLLTWTVAPSDGGGALQLAMTTALTGKTTGTFDDIEDTKIIH